MCNLLYKQIWLLKEIFYLKKKNQDAILKPMQLVQSQIF